MKCNTLVSVIIPTYGRPHLVGRAIASVLRQTYENIEIIVIDDCSDDNTPEVIKRFSDPRIRYLRNTRNLGVSASRNMGIKVAHGKYVSFLDDDDELLPKKIAKQLELLTLKKSVNVAYCSSIKMYRDVSIENKAKVRGNIHNYALRSCPNSINTLLVKRECFDVIGMFDESLSGLFEDWDLWIRLSKRYKFDYVDEPLVIYHLYGEQVSFDLSRKIIASKLIVEKYKRELEKNRKILYWHYRKIASRYSIAGRYKESIKYVLKSIITYPFYPGSYIHLFLLLTLKKADTKMIYKFGLRRIGDLYLL